MDLTSKSSVPEKSRGRLAATIRGQPSLLPKHLLELHLHPKKNKSPKHSQSELCNQCQELEFLDPDYIASKEFDVVFDYAQYRSTSPRCPLCTLIMGRIPEYRLRGSERPDRVPIKLKTRGSLAHIWSGQRCYGRIYPLVNWNDYYTRQVDDQIKIETVKAWLMECETHHNHDEAHVHDPIDLTLIDVDRQCLVRQRSDVEFLALSYVWGGPQIVQTTTQNLADFSLPGAFKDHYPHYQLPPTLSDAIRLTRHLGRKYIWIDSLCIVQDSPDKHDILAQMDLIYSHASLTIVAVDGHSVHVPLPGISISSRPAVMQLAFIKQRPFVSEPPEFLDSHILGSHYESRGWTLQERVLSRRLLYFSAQQVLFQCQHRSRLETERLPEIALPEYINMGDFNPKAAPLEKQIALEKIGNRGGLLLGRQISHLAHISKRNAGQTMNKSMDVADGNTKVQASVSKVPQQIPRRHLPSVPISVQSSYAGGKSSQSPKAPIPPDIDTLVEEEMITASFQASDTMYGGYAAARWPTSRTHRPVTWKELLPIYQDIVELYTSRHLTFSSDVLRAFSGISAIFERLGKSSFVSGLPSRKLAQTLLWTPANTDSQLPLTRRRPDLDKAEYPSWSWAGWEGPVVYEGVFRSREGQGPQFNTQDQVLVRRWERNLTTQNPLSVLSFTATTFWFKPTLLRTGVAPATQNFAFRDAEETCGVLFGTSLPLTHRDRHDSLTPRELGETYTAVLLGIDTDPKSKYELRRKFGVYFRGPGRGWGGVTVYFLLVRPRGRFFERVGAGKMVKSALSSVRCIERLIELV